MVDMAKKKRKRAAAPVNPWPAKLRAIRVRYGLTQTKAAEAIGAVLSTWQNWEYGRRIPNATTAKLIELVFPPV